MKKCKLIKKIIYKTDDPKKREYNQLSNGQVIADIQRSVYQSCKKECKNKTKKQTKEFLKTKKGQ
jgi:hypothetical protein